MQREIQSTTRTVLDGALLAWRFVAGSSFDDDEAVWDRGIDRLFRCGLRPAEQPYRSEVNQDGAVVSYYALELINP